jgi:excisionase family DNA binding protein
MAQGQRDDDTLTLREAAEQLGVHYMTAYHYVRTGRIPGRQRGRVWEVRRADVEALLVGDEDTGEPLHDGRGPRWETHRSRLLSRLVRADLAGAWKVVENVLSAGSDPKDVYLQLLVPVMRDIGERWDVGTVTVAEEHVATTIAARVVGRLGPRFARPGRKRGSVVLAGVSGETHWLPLALLADVLRGDGWAVVDLGADTPAGSIVEAARQVDDLVAIGISVASDPRLATARRTVTLLHKELPGVPVLVGGPAVMATAVADKTGADAWAPDATAASELLGRLAVA